MGYLIYLRKSRADKEAELRGEGETLARHENALCALAQNLAFPIDAIYKEIVSGETIASRPVMQKLLSEVEQGVWMGVLVMEVERLARGDTIDQGLVAQAFKYSGTKIITPMKIYDPANEFDEEYFEFGLFMSRREYKTINRRLQQGRAASVSEGKYAGNVPPYGYRRMKLEQDKGYTLSPIPEQAEIVRMVYKMYANDNFCISKIADKLNELHIPTIKGGIWTVATLQGILENPVYIGKVKWNARKQIKQSINGNIIKTRPRACSYLVAQGLHPPIIAEDLYDAVQKKRRNNPSAPINKQSILKNPLSGLITCASCGRKMVRRPFINDQRKDYLICPLTGCSTVSSPLYLVEEKLVQCLSSALADYKLNPEAAPKENYISSNEEKAALLAFKKKELSSLVIQQNVLYDLLEKGIYSPEVFKQRNGYLYEKITELETIIASLQSELKPQKIRETCEIIYLPKEKSLFTDYDKLDVVSKNMLLKTVLEKTVYYKNARNKKGTGKLAGFELHIYPKII